MRTLEYGHPRRSSARISDGKSRLAKHTEEALRLAEEAFGILREKNGRRRELEGVLKSYRDAIRALAELRSMEAWKLEREILPDEMKNVRLSILGLPETLVPFSLSNSLANPELEARLREIPERSGIMMMIARILDCYARVQLPSEHISGFYRAAAAELRLSMAGEEWDGEPYIDNVVRLARDLTEKHHNLKTNLHKNLCTQTGDNLGQPNPDRNPLSITALRPGKRSTGESIESSLRLRWKVPVVEGIPTGRKYTPPRRADLEGQLLPVAPEGKRTGWVFAHPDLPGMLFNAEQSGEAFSLVINADFFTLRPNSRIQMPEEQSSLIRALRDMKEFRVATHMRDRKGQLKSALELLQMELHVAELLDRNLATETPEAFGIAREHFTKAREWMAQFQEEKDKAPDALTAVPVRRMMQIWKASPHLAPFEIALGVAMEMRGDNKTLSTMRPSFTELPPVSEEEARSLKSPRPPAIPEEWIDPELEEGLSLIGKGDPADPVGRHARKLRYLLAMGSAAEAEEPYREAVEDLLSCYSVEALLRHASKMAEAEPGAEETAEPGPDQEELDIPIHEAPPEAATGPAPPEATPEPAEASQDTPAPVAATLDDYAPTQPVVAEEAHMLAKTLVMEQDEVTQPAIRPAALMLDRLTSDDKGLVMAILGRQGDCSEADIEEFRAMDPGLRDLRFRNIHSEVWTSGDWRGHPETGEQSRFERLSTSLYNLYATCALAPATLEQMKAAALEPSNLTIPQLATVGRFFAIQPGDVAREHIDAFGIWLSGDQERMKAYWRRNHPDAMDVIRLAQKMAAYEVSGARKRNFTREEYAMLSTVFRKPVDRIDINDVKNISAVTNYSKQLQAYHERWFGPSASDRQTFWRRGLVNFVSLTDLVHRTAFLEGWSYDYEDALAVAAICGDKADINKGGERLVGALLKKADNGVYHDEVLDVYDKIFLGKDPVGKLLEEARMQEEFRALSDFLGVRSPRSSGKLVKNGSECRPKFLEETVEDPQSGRKRKATRIGTHAPTNDDAIAQAVVTLPDGRMVELDAVFDGMGGHSTGYVASGIQKSIFEICALSGMIQSPEDVRRAIVMADIAITMEAMRRKRKDSNGDLVAERNKQENNMGTTAVVSFLCGEDLYAIHCGDSDVKVYDDGGNVVASTVGHAFVNELLANGFPLEDPSVNKAQLVAEVISRYATRINASGGQFMLYSSDYIVAESNGVATQFRIFRNGQQACDGVGTPMLQDKLVEVLDIPNGNVVTAAVGNSIRKTAINNMRSGFAPWKLRHGWLLAVCSDGISVPNCDHEIPMAVAACGGDLQKAASGVIDIAESRTPNGTKNFTPGCGCRDRSSKNDDKSLILKRIDLKKNG